MRDAVKGVMLLAVARMLYAFNGDNDGQAAELSIAVSARYLDGHQKTIFQMGVTRNGDTWRT